MAAYPAVEWILHGGSLYTMDPKRPRAEAIALGGGRILAVGRNAEILPLAQAGSRLVNLAGRAVIPGLHDGHVHFLMYARGTRLLLLDGIDSLEQVLQRVKERVESAPPGHWIRGFGYNRNLWADPSYPTRHDLDRVSAGSPVVIVSKDGHSSWVNSAALALAGVTRDTPDPEGGVVQRDSAFGEPTGILLENAENLVERVVPVPSFAEDLDVLRAAIRQAHSVGLVGVHNNEGPDALRAFGALHARGELDLRVVESLPRECLDDAVALGLVTGVGDDRLRIGAVKLFVDGSLGSRTAWMLEPFLGEPDNRGVPVTSREELREMVLKAARAGISAAIHAIGDAATRMTIDILAEARQAANGPFPRLRHRIEHTQLLTPSDLPRMSQWDLIASMQPTHATSDWEMVERHWGERGVGAYAFRTLLERGTRLAFGSDCPVEGLDPLFGIHAAVTRRRADGSPGPEGWHANERLTVTQAVWAFTMGNAYAAGQETRQGSLTPGKLGDLVVLSDDIFQIEPMEILRTRVLATYLDGQPVYQAEGFPLA